MSLDQSVKYSVTIQDWVRIRTFELTIHMNGSRGAVSTCICLSFSIWCRYSRSIINQPISIHKTFL